MNKLIYAVLLVPSLAICSPLFTATSAAASTTFANDHSIVFDGVNNTYIDMGNGAPWNTLDYNVASCVSVWFKLQTVCSATWNTNAFCQVTLLSKQGQTWTNDLSAGWTWLFDNATIGNPRAQVGTAFAIPEQLFDERTTATFADGSWHNVTWSYDGTPSTGHLVIRVDGLIEALTNLSTGTVTSSVLPTQDAVPMIFGAAPMKPGQVPGGAGYWAPGRFAQFAYWQGQACSQTMLSTIFNGGTPGDLSSISPQIWYQFSTRLSPPDIAGTIIYDRGSQGLNGIVHGPATFSTDTP